VAIVETASQLFRLLQEKDNFHLRWVDGRDDALYLEMKNQLRCPEGTGLGTWLEEAQVSAQAFLAAFFAAAKPLSGMYKDIYRGMERARVAGAPERARIRLEDEGRDLDLAHFATVERYLEKLLERRTILLWDAASVGELRDVMGNLLDRRGQEALARTADGRPTLSPLPEAPSDPEIAANLVPAREVLAALIDDHVRGASAPGFELRHDVLGAFNEVCARLDAQNPRWARRAKALEMLRDLPRAPTFKNEEKETLVEVFRTVLDLPLWKHRWYIYEVWTAFRILGTLKDFSPVLDTNAEGQLALIRGRSTRVAKFEDEHGASYVLAAQKQTPVVYAGRVGISPDYRVIREHDDATLLIVECKQRVFFAGQAAEENMAVYEAGAPTSLLNLFVNYDSPGPPARVPPRTRLLEAFRPGQTPKLEDFDRLVLQALVGGEVRPPRPVVVLLDISGSMKNAYSADTHAAFWRWLQAQPGLLTVYRFTTRLDAEPVALDSLQPGWSGLVCDGGTDLPAAIREVVGRHGDRVRVLAVTDIEPDGALAAETRYWKPSAGDPEDVWRNNAGEG
jgi:hypothetical protein